MKCTLNVKYYKIPNKRYTFTHSFGSDFHHRAIWLITKTSCTQYQCV